MVLFKNIQFLQQSIFCCVRL